MNWNDGDDDRSWWAVYLQCICDVILSSVPRSQRDGDATKTHARQLQNFVVELWTDHCRSAASDERRQRRRRHRSRSDGDRQRLVATGRGRIALRSAVLSDKRSVLEEAHHVGVLVVVDGGARRATAAARLARQEVAGEPQQSGHSRAAQTAGATTSTMLLGHSFHVLRRSARRSRTRPDTSVFVIN